MNAKSRLIAVSVCVQLFRAGSVSAQVAAEDLAGERVEVFSPALIVSIGKPATAKYSNLQRGVAAFNENKQLAPNATLRFKIKELKKVEGKLGLKLVSEDTNQVLAVNENAEFIAPESLGSAGKDAELVVNRRAGDALIKPSISSPGFTPTYQRLGDMRLFCEVSWAIQEGSDSFKGKAMSALVGGVCKGKNTRNSFSVALHDGLVDAVELSQGERNISLLVDEKSNSYIVPLNDLSWSNDATVTVTLKSVPQDVAHISN